MHYVALIPFSQTVANGKAFYNREVWFKSHYQPGIADDIQLKMGEVEGTCL